jgi:peptidoglycan/xylan/chitin deacetylase (PgdA/CDA1 family)
VLPFLGGRDLEAEVEGGADAIARVLGARPRFFRCTKGYKSRRVLRAVRRKGMVPIGFSYPIFDVENPPPGELVARVLGRARAGDILLMHDGYAASKRGSRESLVEALPRIIEGLRGCGLRFVTLEEAFPPSGPGR